MKFAPIALLLLLSSVAYAATPPTVTIVDPTTNTDGSAIPSSGPGALVSRRIEYGTCSGTAFGTKQGEVVVAEPATTYVFSGLTTPGDYCFQGYALNTYGLESAVSNVVKKTVVAPTPGKATLSMNVFEKQNGKVVLVGKIALKVKCGADAKCQSPFSGAELFNVPRNRVTFTPHKDTGAQTLGVCA